MTQPMMIWIIIIIINSNDNNDDDDDDDVDDCSPCQDQDVLPHCIPQQEQLF